MLRKGNARENILMIAALSDGQIKKRICEDICATPRYTRKIMEKMNNDENVETVFGTNPRVLRIKPNGIKLVEDQIPWLKQRVQEKKMNAKKDRAQRQADVSQTMYNMQLADIEYYPLAKVKLEELNKHDIEAPGVYYAPVEMKANMYDEEDEKSKESGRSSRICGMYYTNNQACALYNLNGRNLKYYRKTEMRFLGEYFLKYQRKEKQAIKKVFFGEGYEGLKQIIENTKVESKRYNKKTGVEYSYVTIENDSYYVPNGPEGAKYLRMIDKPEVTKRIKTILSNSMKKEVIVLLPISLPAIKVIMETKQQETIVCLPEQEAIYKAMFGNKVEVLKIEEDKALSMFGINLNNEKEPCKGNPKKKNKETDVEPEIQTVNSGGC